MTPRVLGQTLLDNAEAWLPLAGLFVVAALVAFLFDRSVVHAIRGPAKRAGQGFNELIVKTLHPALSFALFVVVVWVGVKYVLPPLPPSVELGTRQTIQAITIILAALVLGGLLHGYLKYRAERLPQFLAAASLGGRAISIIVYLVAFALILGTYGVEITPLLTTFGLAGIAVALALQDTLTNFFAGIWIQTGRALRPGHFVRVENEKVEGYVVEVGWRTTQMRTLSNNLVVIPNSKLAQSTITDYHLPTPRTVVLVPITVGYEADPADVERMLLEEARGVADRLPGLLKEPPPTVRFEPGFGEYALGFTLACHLREYADQFQVLMELRKRILVRFRDEGIRIPYPTRENIQIVAGRKPAASTEA